MRIGLKIYEIKNGIKFPPQLRNQLKNKAKLSFENDIFIKDEFLIQLTSLLSISSNTETDFATVNKMYRNRIHKGHKVIGECNNGSDLLLENTTNGGIYFWDHETNDLGILDIIPNFSVEKPRFICNDLQEILKNLVNISSIPLPEIKVLSVTKSNDFNELFAKYLKK